MNHSIRALWQKRERTQRAIGDVEYPSQGIDDLVPRREIDINVRGMLDEYPDHLMIGDARVDDLVQAIAATSIAPIAEPLPVGAATPAAQAIERTISIDTPSTLPMDADVAMYAMPIPVDAFVSAPEVTSWHTGRGKSIKNGRTSAQTVASYASMRADTSPPIQHVTVYVRPDGTTFAKLHGDGAHRLCAAKRRGDHDVYARNVRVVLLRSAA